jgi:hypothetical protein
MRSISGSSITAIGIAFIVLITCGIVYMIIVNRKSIAEELSRKPSSRRKPVKSYGSQDEADIIISHSDEHAQIPLMNDYKTPQSIHK